MSTYETLRNYQVRNDEKAAHLMDLGVQPEDLAFLHLKVTVDALRAFLIGSLGSDVSDIVELDEERRLATALDEVITIIYEATTSRTAEGAQV